MRFYQISVHFLGQTGNTGENVSSGAAMQTNQMQVFTWSRQSEEWLNDSRSGDLSFTQPSLLHEPMTMLVGPSRAPIALTERRRPAGAIECRSWKQTRWREVYKSPQLLSFCNYWVWCVTDGRLELIIHAVWINIKTECVGLCGSRGAHMSDTKTWNILFRAAPYL